MSTASKSKCYRWDEQSNAWDYLFQPALCEDYLFRDSLFKPAGSKQKKRSITFDYPDKGFLPLELIEKDGNIYYQIRFMDGTVIRISVTDFWLLFNSKWEKRLQSLLNWLFDYILLPETVSLTYSGKQPESAKRTPNSPKEEQESPQTECRVPERVDTIEQPAAQTPEGHNAADRQPEDEPPPKSAKIQPDASMESVHLITKEDQ